MGACMQALYYLIDLQWDPNAAVMHAAGVALSIIIVSGSAWARQVRGPSAARHAQVHHRSPCMCVACVL